MTTTAPRKRDHSLAVAMREIIRAGLVPRMVHHPDGRVEVTGLSPEAVASADQAAADDAAMDAALGRADGNRV